jgi:cell division protein DivIC
MGAVRKRNVAKIETKYVKQQEDAVIATARKKRILMRRLAVFFLLVCITAYFMVSSILTQASALDVKAAQKKQLDQSLSSLKAEQKSLKDEIVKLNDDDYIAKLARKEYFLSDKNEIIFNIPEDKK